MTYPKLIISSATKNCIDAAIELVEEHVVDIGISVPKTMYPSQNADPLGWGSVRVHDYVRSKTSYLFLHRDSGNRPDALGNDGDFSQDCAQFDFVSVDPWYTRPKIDSDVAVASTINDIRRIHAINPSVAFQIGTFEHIKQYTPSELSKFLKGVKAELPRDMWKNIVYCCIQDFRKLDVVRGRYATDFDVKLFSQFIDVCDSYGLKCRDFSSDFQSSDLLSWKFENGLDVTGCMYEPAQIELSLYWQSALESDSFEALAFMTNKTDAHVPANTVCSDKELLVAAYGDTIIRNGDLKEIRHKLHVRDSEISFSIVNWIMDNYITPIHIADGTH